MPSGIDARQSELKKMLAGKEEMSTKNSQNKLTAQLLESKSINGEFIHEIISLQPTVQDEGELFDEVPTNIMNVEDQPVPGIETQQSNTLNTSETHPDLEEHANAEHEVKTDTRTLISEVVVDEATDFAYKVYFS